MRHLCTCVPGLGLILTVVFTCAPVSGVEIGSFVDSPDGNCVDGYSYTQLDYDDYWEGYEAAGVVSSLSNDGDALDTAEGGANADETYAEGDVSWCDESGTYTVAGDHYLFSPDFWWVEVAESSAGMDFLYQGGGGGGGCGDGGAPACILPDTDVSVFCCGLPAPNSYAAKFDAYALLSSSNAFPQDTWGGIASQRAVGGAAIRTVRVRTTRTCPAL
jgi:hypothetical protein